MCFRLDFLGHTIHQSNVKKPVRFEKKRPANTQRRQKRVPDAARFAAAQMLIKVLEEKKTLDEAMNLECFMELDGRDRGFSAAVTKETLRFFGKIDDLLNNTLQKPLPETAYYARALLRSAIGQFISDIAPIHAIINSAVELAKADRVAQGMSGLINAVLRKIIANKQPQDYIDEIKAEPEILLPLNFRQRYLSYYGKEKTQKIALSILNQAPIDLSIKASLNEDERKLLLSDFDGELLAPNVLRLKSFPEKVSELESWKSGFAWVQDAAASLPANLLKPQKGQAILDMCAAPGGKTMQLCASFAKVTALDVNEHRLKIVAQNLARTGLYAKLLEGDAIKVSGDNEYDSVLLDAPCLATGTLRKNLESLWIKTPFDVPRFAQTQAELINASYKALKKGGTMVYAVCSMEPEEADLAINAALEAGFVIDKIDASEAYGIKEAVEERGTLRLLPYMMSENGGLDGFFIARFRK